MGGLDPERLTGVITEAINGPGGVALVLNVFATVPGVVHAPAKRGMFRSEPERIAIGDWRYEVGKDGRLRAGHVVNGIVIAEEAVDAHAVGTHLARSLTQIATRYGPPAVTAIDAALEALGAGSGGL